MGSKTSKPNRHEGSRSSAAGGLVEVLISHAVTWSEARLLAEQTAGGLPTCDELRAAGVTAGDGVDLWMPVCRPDGREGDYCQIGNHPMNRTRYISHIDAYGMPAWFTNKNPAGWRPGPASTSCKGIFYARAKAGSIQKVEVGRVVSWFEARDRAAQMGGRLPTTAELRAAKVDVGYDQWTPITATDGDPQTGRRDGVRNNGENAWANIGPRKYQIEYPAWGVDASKHPWKHLTYFYVAVGGVGSGSASTGAGFAGDVRTLDMAHKDGRGGFKIHPVLAVTGRTVGGKEELVPGFVDPFNHVNHSLNYHQAMYKAVKGHALPKGEKPGDEHAVGWMDASSPRNRNRAQPYTGPVHMGICKNYDGNGNWIYGDIIGDVMWYEWWGCHQTRDFQYVKITEVSRTVNAKGDWPWTKLVDQGQWPGGGASDVYTPPGVASGGAADQGLFVLHDADFAGRSDRCSSEPCGSLAEAARLVEAKRTRQHDVAYAWRKDSQLVTIPVVGAGEMGNGAKWSTGATLLVHGIDTGHRAKVALRDVDCCFGDGRVDGGVHSFEAALALIKRRDSPSQTAYFLHSSSSRLIEKPKNRGANWVGYPNYGWLFLWADARADDPKAAAGGAAMGAAAAPKTISLSGTGGPHPHFNDIWNLDTGGQNGKVCYRRRGNPGDLIKWDGQRWTVNGTGPFQGANCAYWHSADTPWPPAAGWQHHPQWWPTVAAAGGFQTIPAGAPKNDLSGAFEASLFSPAVSGHLSNDGTFHKSEQPAPWQIQPTGALRDGVAVHLCAATGKFLRSDGVEAAPPAWADARGAATRWILRFDGELSAETAVQIQRPDEFTKADPHPACQASPHPALCNDMPTGGWGGATAGAYSYSPDKRGDSFWTLTGIKPVAEPKSSSCAAAPQPAAMAGELASAAWDGDLGRVRSLLARGAPPNTEAFDGFSNGHHSALNGASRNGHAAIVAMLLEQPVRPDIESRCQGPWEVTPLQQAAFWGRADCAKILLEHGASTSSTSGPGFQHKTARQIAQEHKQNQWRELVALIDGAERPDAAPQPAASAGGGTWERFENIDMCGQGDVQIVGDWKRTHSLEELKRIVERNNWSAICVGSFGHAALKNFDYQLRRHHCKPSEGYTCTIHVFTPPPARAKPDGGPKPNLVLVDQHDGRRLSLLHAASIGGGQQAPLALAPPLQGYGVCRQFAERRDAFGEWEYTALGVGPAAEAVVCAMSGGQLVEGATQGVLTPSMLQLHEGNHYDLVWHKHHHPARLHEEVRKHGAPLLDFVIHPDGSVAPAHAPHLRLGLEFELPPLERVVAAPAKGPTMVVQGVVVEGSPLDDKAGGAESSGAAGSSSECPPLVQAAEVFKRELNVKGTNLLEVVDAACEALGVSPDGLNAMEKAARCWEVLKG